MCADSAYPISEKLIKPYFQPVDQHKRLFNHLLSGIRTVCTENMLALLKLRFPALRLGLRTKIQNACDDVAAMVVLHNFSWQLRNTDLKLRCYSRLQHKVP